VPIAKAFGAKKVTSQKIHIMDGFFAVSATLICFVAVYLGNECAKYQAEVRADPLFSSVEAGFPEPIDLVGGFVAACVIGLFRYFAFHTFRPLGPYIMSAKKGADKDRLDRFAVCCFKFLYFVVITAIGWYVMKDEDWFPPVLGGSGATVNCYKGFPFHQVSQTIRIYYMTQLGYHTHSLLFLVFFSTPRNDYTEMVSETQTHALSYHFRLFLTRVIVRPLLQNACSIIQFIHHCCAITAVWVSWLFNYWKVRDP
jgi:hypothetical protein